MTARMMQFVSVPQAMPDKRAVAERRQDFREIYDQFQPERAAEQAARCEQCGIPFCQVHCPLHNNIPDWLRMTAEGRLEEAYELAAATNNMPEICGRICPQDRLCEGNCVIEKGFENGHHRRGREVHHRHRLRDGLGQAAEAAPASAPNRSASSAPGRPGSPPPSSCAGRATRSTSTTATTGSAAC